MGKYAVKGEETKQLQQVLIHYKSLEHSSATGLNGAFLITHQTLWKAKEQGVAATMWCLTLHKFMHPLLHYFLCGRW